MTTDDVGRRWETFTIAIDDLMPRIREIINLPDDAEFLDAFVDDCSGTVEFTFQSPQFDINPMSEE